MAENIKTTIKKHDLTTTTTTTSTSALAATAAAAATTNSSSSAVAVAAIATATTSGSKTTQANSVAKVNGIINTLFFDLDNTLIPTRAGDQKAIRKLADVLENQFAFGKEESSAATQSFLKAFRRCTDNSQTSLDSWRTYLWRESLPARYKHLAEQIYPIWLQLRYRYVCVPNEFLQMLRRFREVGFLLALITNGPSNAQWEKIRKLNVSQYFDCVLVSSDLPWEKPNPNIFYAACNFLGVKAAECAMIGDKLESDIKGGKVAKLGATFWVPLSSMETNLNDVAYPPDYILKNLLDICKYFPILNDAASGSGSGSTTAAAAHTAAAQFRRRSSQIVTTTVAAATTATTSTCASDFYCSNYNFSQHHQHMQQQQQQQQQPQTHYHQHQHQRHQSEQPQQHFNQQHQNYDQSNKYRRAGSLPIECFGSETENSSDSYFS